MMSGFPAPTADSGGSDAAGSGFADSVLARIQAEIAADRPVTERERLVGTIRAIEEAARAGRVPEAEVLLTVLPDHVLAAPLRYFSSSCLLALGQTIAGLSPDAQEVPSCSSPS